MTPNQLSHAGQVQPSLLTDTPESPGAPGEEDGGHRAFWGEWTAPSHRAGTGARHAQSRVGWQSSTGHGCGCETNGTESLPRRQQVHERGDHQPASPTLDAGPAARPGPRETESEERRHARCSTHALATGTHVRRTDTTREVTWGARQGPRLIAGQRKGWAGNATSPQTTARLSRGPGRRGEGPRGPGEGAGLAPGRTHTGTPGHTLRQGTGVLPGGLLTMVTERRPPELHHRLEGSEAARAGRRLPQRRSPGRPGRGAASRPAGACPPPSPGERGATRPPTRPPGSARLASPRGPAANEQRPAGPAERSSRASHTRGRPALLGTCCSFKTSPGPRRAKCLVGVRAGEVDGTPGQRSHRGCLGSFRPWPRDGGQGPGGDHPGKN